MSGYSARSATKPLPGAEVALPAGTRFLRVPGTYGAVLSKSGIYDQIHGDHAWCQWFGLRMFEVLPGMTEEGGPVGFRYPSRKHRSHLALAVQSG
ncbi:MAG TPA: hypothetical protein VM659_07510 [Dongiaceae bacterium]|nr:hypothetical protein [Dongiaceae bacterium]